MFVLASIYDSFGDPGRKNPVTMPINKMIVDSRILEVNIASIPKNSLKPHLQNCKPDIKLLIRRPLRLMFEIKSGFNKTKSNGIVKDGSRKLMNIDSETKKHITNKVRS